MKRRSISELALEADANSAFYELMDLVASVESLAGEDREAIENCIESVNEQLELLTETMCGIGLAHYKQKFIGGVLDGKECMAASHGGINDGFWYLEYATEESVYTYSRQESNRYCDSDYRLESVEPRPAHRPVNKPIS